MSIFVIVNEFEPKGGNPSVEIVENKYYSTETQAWEALRDMAAEFGAYLGPDDSDFSVDLRDDSHLEYDEYYIIELEEAK